MIVKNQFFQKIYTNLISNLRYVWVFLIIILISFLVLTENYFSMYLQGFTGVSSSHQSGFYNSSFKLKLYSILPFTKVLYTTDGSEPVSSSEVYIEREVNKPQAIKAKVYFMNNPIGVTYNFTFIVGEKLDLPTFSMIGDSDKLFGLEGILTKNFELRGFDSAVPVHLEYFNEQGKLDFKQDIGVRVFGGASRKQPQKSLRICADREYGLNEMKFSFFENQSDDFKCIVLRNFGNDWGKSLIRDVFAQKIASETLDETLNSKLVKVYINGEFYGLASLTEFIDQRYLQERYGGKRISYSIIEVSKNKEGLYRVNYGSEDAALEFQEILQFTSKNALSLPENFKYVEDRVDLDNFIDYYIYQTFFSNRDWINSNIRIWKYQKGLQINSGPQERVLEDNPKLDGKFRYILYDMDVTSNFSEDQVNVDNLAIATTKIIESNEWNTLLFRKLLSNSEFKNKFLERYFYLSSTTLNPINLEQKLKIVYNDFYPHMPYFFERWGGTTDWKDRIAVSNYDLWNLEVKNMVIFIQNRNKIYEEDLKDL